MLKYIYRLLFLCAIFAGALFIFGRNIKEVTIDSTGSVSMAESTFPLLYLQVGDYTVNTLHGYSSNISAREVRESITPLDYDKSFKLYINENQSTVKKLDYEVRGISDNNLLASDSLTVFETESGNGCRKAKITLDTNLDTSTEYGMKFTITTSSSKKIHYYTRVKYYESDFFLDDKMDFIQKFHTQTFKKNDVPFLTSCLEPSADEDNSTFSKVTIYSSYDMVTWDDMKPTVVSEIVPTIKEFNIETAAIQMDYFATAKTNSGKELYHVKEFYRVRYTTERMYMLYFERTMETVFDPSLTSLRKSEFLLGITSCRDFNITTSDKNNKMAFVRNGSLWYYNLESGELTSVFSFDYQSAKYEWDLYDKHDIQILKMDDEGNIRFVVYGYMNRGDYEGRVAIILYDYNAQTNQILERVYIPLTTTFDKLKQDFGTFCYVNDKDIFYFSIDNIVYAYNIASKKYVELVSHITDDNFLVIEDTTSFIWMNSDDVLSSDLITIMNLEDESTVTISSKKQENLTLLGMIDNNFIYGYVRSKDIRQLTDGTTLVPCYKVVICDPEGNILKTYKKKNRYVTDVTVDDNVVTMSRVKKESSGNTVTYTQASSDSILNRINNSPKSIDLTTRTTDLTKTEYYISLPTGYKMLKIPDVAFTRNTIVTEDTTLHLDESHLKQDKYYIYAHGGITLATQNVSEAIILADEQMGVVLDRKSRLVWERGGKFNSKTIGGINTVYTEAGITNTGACVSMLLSAAQVTKAADSLSDGSSIMKLLRKNLDTPVNLTGCTLDEVLYFVSRSNPVIAMKNSSEAVLITAYSASTVTYIDPSAHTTTTASLANAEAMFSDAGSVYISYLK